MGDKDERDRARRWVERYVEAWRSNDPDAIGALFTNDADYYTAPYRDPWRGREAIVSGWLRRRDTEGSWTFRFDVLVAMPEIALVRGWTDYPDEGQHYANLWCLRLEGDRCAEFVEWWMESS